MGSRRKPKNEFGVELLSFCAANGLTYKDVCEGAGVRRTTLVECTTGRCAGSAAAVAARLNRTA